MPTDGELWGSLFGLSPPPGTMAEAFAQGTPYSAFPTFLRGADPTGIIDATAKINAAIAQLPATGGCLVIPQGTYNIVGPVSALPANSTLTGAGEFSTTLNTALASGTFLSFSGANATLSNLTITNTNASNTAAAMSLAAAQLAVQNVAINGFGSTSGTVALTSASSLASLINLTIKSTVASAVGISANGSDNQIQGGIFDGLATGIVLQAPTNIIVSAAVFDACTTGISVAPAGGQAASGITIAECVFDQNTTSLSFAPTSTGTATYLTVSDCDIMAATSAAIGIVVNGAASHSVQYLTVETCDIVCSGTNAVGFTYTAGGNAAAPISFLGCNINSTKAVGATAVGGANTQPFVFRSCPGVNPVGNLSSQPGVPATTTPLTNSSGCDCMVFIVPGTAATTVSIGGTSTGVILAGSGVGGSFRVPYGQSFTLTYASGSPATAWFGD